MDNSENSEAAQGLIKDWLTTLKKGEGSLLHIL